MLTEDAKIFVKGRISVEEDKDGKLICEQIVSFEDAAAANGEPIFQNRYGRGSGYGKAAGYHASGYGKAETYHTNGSGDNSVREGQTVSGPKGMPKGIWIQFPDVETYQQREQ